MGIFNHHQANMDKTLEGVHASEGNKTQETSKHGSTSGSATSSQEKSSCGCGCAHRAKPLGEDFVEIKEEEWDY